MMGEANGAAHWIGCMVAVVISIVMSGFTVMGFVLQKKASMVPARWTIGDINLSPQWFLGFILGTLVPIPGTVLAYDIAPMALISPLSGITVAMNMAIAPRMLGERLQKWPDVSASAAILLGTLLTTAAGPHQTQDFSPSELEALFCKPAFVKSIAVLGTIQVGGMMYMSRRAKAMEKSAMARPINPNMLEVTLPGIVAAGWGCFSNIALKGVGILLGKNADLLEWVQWLSILVISAMAQINYVNKGLHLYLQTVFLPVYSALLVVCNTLYGLIFYEEYTDLLHDSGKCAVFVSGVAFIVFGVTLFTLRRSKGPEDETECPTGSALSQGMVAGLCGQCGVAEGDRTPPSPTGDLRA